MPYVAHARLGQHVRYDSPRTMTAALTYAAGEFQESLLLGWSPWDGTRPAWPGIVDRDRPPSIANLLDRLSTHGLAWERVGLRGMRIWMDRAALLAALKAGRPRDVAALANP